VGRPRRILLHRLRLLPCHDRPAGRWFAVAGADRGQPVAILDILAVPLGHNGD